MPSSQDTFDVVLVVQTGPGTFRPRVVSCTDLEDAVEFMVEVCHEDARVSPELSYVHLPDGSMYARRLPASWYVY